MAIRHRNPLFIGKEISYFWGGTDTYSQLWVGKWLLWIGKTWSITCSVQSINEMILFLVLVRLTLRLEVLREASRLSLLGINNSHSLAAPRWANTHLSLGIGTTQNTI